MDKMAVRATGIDLRQASLAVIATALQEGRVSSAWLVNQYLGESPHSWFRVPTDGLDNIARDNDHYNAVFETVTRESGQTALPGALCARTGPLTIIAVKAAQALDDERQSGKSRGPLHGIPILVK